MSYYQLARTTDSQLQQLGQILWSWERCDDCRESKLCTAPECSSKQFKRLSRFFQRYKELTAAYEPDLSPGEKSCLRSHEDLFFIIEELKSDPNISRADLTNKLLEVRPELLSGADRDEAINLAVRVMIMVNCSAEYRTLGVLESGPHQIPWPSGVTFSQFVSDIFPVTDHPSLNDDAVVSPYGMKAVLTARRLQKRAGLKLRPTDDLRRHLMLDHENSIVEIFHHTAFLKEHLRLTKDKPRNISTSESLKIGALPRQLALEVLDSIQKVLFPISDRKSYSLLVSLTSTSLFDPDSLRFDFTSIRNLDETDVSYHYFGSRLVDLYEALEHPKPHGWVQKWVERKSGARYVMMATLLGVVIAVMLGMASLALGGYQAWLGYQQWQHPVNKG